MQIRTALCLSLLVAFLALGCTSEELPTAVSEDLESPVWAEDALAKHTPSGPLFFTGYTRFGAYYARTGEVFADPADWYCELSATLNFVDGQDFILETNWDPPCERTIVHAVKMTPSGAIKLWMPDDEIPGMREHTGCDFSGSFPVFHGHYDGDRFYVATQWHGLCTGGNLWSWLFGVSLEKGPVHVTMSYDLIRDGS